MAVPPFIFWLLIAFLMGFATAAYLFRPRAVVIKNYQPPTKEEAGRDGLSCLDCLILAVLGLLLTFSLIAVLFHSY